MKKRVVVSDVEAISTYGNDINTIFRNLIIEKRCLLTEKFNHISNFIFHDYQYNVKTRIDVCGQLCIHTTAGLLKKKSIYDSDRIGLITASKNGCAISKSRYIEQLRTYEDPQLASPKDFVLSICNIPNSQATIECGIQGITNHYPGASDASLTGLWQAVKCVEDGMADEMVVGAFDITPEDQKRFLLDIKYKDFIFSDAAASVRLLSEEYVNQEDVIFEILGIGFGSDVETESAVRVALSNAIKDSNINEEDVSLIISNSNTISEFYKNELKGIEGVFNRPVPTCLLKRYTGECYAAFPLLSIAVLSRMSGYCLTNNSFDVSGEINSKFLDYKNFTIKPGSISLVIGYSDCANAVAICLKHRK